MAGAQLAGADTLARTLHAAAGELEELTEAEHGAGQLLAEAGARSAPRETGRLSSAHGYTLTPAGVAVTAATAYAAIVHASQPWLTQTVAAQTEQITDLYLSNVTDVLATVKGT